MQDRKYVVDVAISLFLEKGYEHVSVGEICKAAGIANGTFYNQFKSKGNLLQEYCSSILLFEKALFSAVTEASPLDRLMSIYRTVCQSFGTLTATLARSYFAVLLEKSEYWASGTQLVSRMEDVYCNLIEAAQKQKEILSADSPHALYIASQRMSRAIYIYWAANPKGFDLEKEFMAALELVFQVAPHKRRYSFVTETI